MYHLYNKNLQKPCSWTQNRISIETDGYTRPCCLEISKNARIAKITNGIVNAFNDKKLIDLDHNLRNNGFNENTDFACVRCRQLEQQNLESLRTTTKYLSDKREIKAIQFKLSNRCQLTCAHCSPELSSSWAKKTKISPIVQDSFVITEQFLNELTFLLPNLSEIKFTGGEPFLDPNHWKILEYLKKFNRSNCELVYITNGLIQPKFSLFEGWKKVTCNVSIDGYEDTYHWFRRGGKWDTLLHNIEKYKNFTDVKIIYSITPWTLSDVDNIKNLFQNTSIFLLPIVKPTYCSLMEFPREVASKYWKETKFYNMTSINGNMKIYKDFAVYWDNMWNTNGWANKLYPWLDS